MMSNSITRESKRIGNIVLVVAEAFTASLLCRLVDATLLSSCLVLVFYIEHSTDPLCNLYLSSSEVLSILSLSMVW